MRTRIGLLALVAGCGVSPEDHDAQSARITALEQDVAALAAELAEVQEAQGLTTDDLDAALQGVATEQWVQDQGYQTASDVGTALQGVATEAWVAANYATAQDIADALPAGTLATQSWVATYFVTQADVDLAIDDALPNGAIATEAWATTTFSTPTQVQASLDAALPAGTVASQEWVAANYATPTDISDALEAALPSDPIASENWVAGNYVAISAIGYGLAVDGTSGDVEIDVAEVESIATGSNVLTDLQTAFDARYVPLTGNLAADLNIDVALRVADADHDCQSPGDVGTIRYTGDRFQGCTALGWAPLGGGRDGLSPVTAGASCAEIKVNLPSSPSAPYWLLGNTGPYQAYCDMFTDGGGWTLVGTISGGDANNWNTLDGYWNNAEVLGSALQPWDDHKSAAWFELPLDSSSEVLYQRRFQDTVRAQILLDSDCLFDKQSFGELFATYDTSLRCTTADMTTVLPAATAAGVAGASYREGSGNGAMDGADSNGLCWNGGDTNTNTFWGRLYWSVSAEDCEGPSHYGGIAVWSTNGSQHAVEDIPNTNWLTGTTRTDTDISLFIR